VIRRGRDLAAEGVSVLEIGGAHAVGWDRFAPTRSSPRIEPGPPKGSYAASSPTGRSDSQRRRSRRSMSAACLARLTVLTHVAGRRVPHRR
jgi:hypothetical protein